MKKISSKVVTPLTALIALALAPQAFAQTITASDTTATINGEHSVSVTIDRGGVTMTGFVFTLNYDTAYLSLPTQHTDPAVPHPNVTTVGTGAADFGCTENTVGTLFCITSNAVSSPTFVVNINFTVGGDEIADPGTALDLSDVVGQTNYVGPSPDFEDTAFATVTDGSVVINAAPPNVTLSYSPVPGPVAFTGGTQNDVVNSAITVTAGGTSGSGSVTGCVIGGANAGAFAVTSGDLNIAAGANDTIDLTATLDDAPISATLTCTETDSDSAGVARVWQLSAPAGTPVPSPGYASSPAAGTALECNGSPGETAQTSITVSNDGNPGAGSDLTFDCSVTGADFSILGATGDTLAVGESAQVTVECTVPAEDAPAVVGNLNCTSNDPGAASNDYPLSSIAETALPPIVQPNVVPASSLWSQLSLIGLMAALGLLVVGLRRKG